MSMTIDSSIFPASTRNDPATRSNVTIPLRRPSDRTSADPTVKETAVSHYVTIVFGPTNSDLLEQAERESWLRLSAEGLSSAYGDDEPDYSVPTDSGA